MDPTERDGELRDVCRGRCWQCGRYFRTSYGSDHPASSSASMT